MRQQESITIPFLRKQESTTIPFLRKQESITIPFLRKQESITIPFLRKQESKRFENGFLLSQEWKWLGMEMARNGNGREWARDLSQSSISSSRSRSGSKFCVSRSRTNDLTRVNQPAAVLVTS